MRIVTVIPISRGISKDTLTYFTTKDANLGSIVSIPLRKKIVYGLVVGNREVKEIKSELKSLSYSIRKIERVETKVFLSDAFVKAVQKIADYHASSVGAVLSVLIPKAVLENSSELPVQEKNPLSGVFNETLLLQSSDEERYANYKSLIREEFAKNRSVFFCLPTIEDLLNIKSNIEKGIEKYTFVLHGGLAKKEIIGLWQKIMSENHPVVIVATGSFLSLPRSDIGTIILEKESSRSYKMQTRPYIDIRSAVQILAKESNIRLVLGDTLLRVETLWQEKNGKYAELSPLKFRFLGTGNTEIIDTKSPLDMKTKEFMVLSTKVKNLIINAVENNEQTFLFCGRKGLYPITVCSDCGTTVVCKNCNAPVVLYSKKSTHQNKKLFVCNHCGERRDAEELCVKCGGWRLNTIGIGVDKVVEEVQKLLPKAKIIVMDKDHIKTHKMAVKTRDMFYGNPGNIMIGTEMALLYLNQKIENSVVVSIDSYFSVPDFQINEKIFHILLSMRTVSEKNFFVQTRQNDTKIFDNALRGNLADFYRDEIEDRKSIGYPPFVTYIKITLEGEKLRVKKEMEKVLEQVKPYELKIFEAWNPGSNKKFLIHGLITLEAGKWPDMALLERLRALPPQCSVKIDPLTLL